jgi:PAS domain S-box-containing protein
MRFLLIDDHPGDRELMRQQLHQAFRDAEFIEVARRQEFDIILARGGIDIVLTDYQLHWADGLWVLKSCQAHLPQVPVIMFTDTGSEEIAVTALRAGLSDYVLKSHPQRLPVAVLESLEKAQWRQQQVEAEAALRQAKVDLERQVEARTRELQALTDRLRTELAERQRVEAALRESEARLRAILENTPAIIYLIDPKSRFLFINRHFERLFHITNTQVVGQPLQAVFAPEIAAAFEANNYQVIAAGTALEFEEVAPHDDGLRTYLSVKVPLYDAHGHVYAVCGISTDITARKQMEAQLQASLSEKEVLLREVHHRVKNNLQVISSLLDLQAETVADPQVQALFEESQQRIRTIALIHENLHQSTDLTRVDSAVYFRQLATQLFEAYGAPPHRIALRLDVAEVALEVQTAITCGLILQELLSNCLKHAFPAGRAGEVHIALQVDPAGQAILSIRDTGAGFPEGLDFRHTDSLGLQLVCLLTEQLGGTITLTHQGGTQWTLTLPVLSMRDEPDDDERGAHRPSVL